MSRAAEESGWELGHMVQPPQASHQRNQAAEGDPALQDVGRDSAWRTLFWNVFIPFSRGETQLDRWHMGALIGQVSHVIKTQSLKVFAGESLHTMWISHCKKATLFVSSLNFPNFCTFANKCIIQTQLLCRTATSTSTTMADQLLTCAPSITLKKRRKWC